MPKFTGFVACCAFCVFGAPSSLRASTFRVSFDSFLRAQSATGRLVVYLLPGHPKMDPADEVFYAPSRPIFGVDVRDLQPGDAVKIDDAADAFPAKLSTLPRGDYTAQAVLDLNDATSDWQSEAGNLYSEPTPIHIAAGETAIALSLTKAIAEELRKLPAGLELFTMKSTLLSNFAGHEVMLNATVLPPTHFDASRKYAAIYHVPGFGGRHWDGIGAAKSRDKRAAATQPDAVQDALDENAFNVFLDPESSNGHTFFCDSAVNGPWGRALTGELIPALEGKFPLAAEPAARLVRGHSSGGWATVWLITEYPQIFGAGWTSSPDPVDFHRFECSNLYDQSNFYHAADGKPLPSFRKGEQIVLHIEDENRMEAVVGPHNSSGQQWATWMSCWGTRDANGRAKPLWNPQTGEIDRAEVEAYRKYDVVERLKADPRKFLPIFADHLRLVVGGADSFYLNEAVELLKAELDRLNVFDPAKTHCGYIKIVPKANHSSVFGSAEIKAFPQEMLEHLRRHGLAK